ncbi:MAG: RecX family transcriptional regulator, partial [Endomicrobium sp.]|nr:RecX family transcriptional regulator [Endomicrobium sp.]
MIISKIEKIKLKRNDFKIYFDNNKESLVIPVDSIVKFNIKIGMNITRDVYKRILLYSKSKNVIFEAMILASKRFYSTNDLKKKLIKKKYKHENVVKAIEKLKEFNYINDNEFVKNRVLYLLKKCNGEILIKHKLRKHGFDDEMINNAIKNIKVGDIIVKQIVAVLKLKFKNLELKDKNSI